MLRVSAKVIAALTGGEILSGDGAVIGNDLFIDSREAAPGCIFVALSGERVDGHDFLEPALEAGARVLVVTREREQLAGPIIAAQDKGAVVIQVPDAVVVVQELARHHRTRLQATVVGITGSTGKTTTKDMVRAVLGRSMRVVSTEGNRNNELGVPLTILQAGSDTDALVVEMGMRGIGQIARLAEIAQPNVGLVTNVGTSHIELLGTQARIAEAKGELARGVTSDGVVLLNGDDAYSDAIAATSSAPVVYYGLSEQCTVTAIDIELDEQSRASFTLVAPEGRIRVALGVSGRHNVYNALAAAAVGLRLAVPMDRIADGLSSADMSAMRMEVFTSASGITVVNDAYNANPTSMRAAIDTLSTMSARGRRIAVLGDMAELGSLTELAHFEIGETVAEQSVDILVAVGPRAKRFADGALAAGMEPDAVFTCGDSARGADLLNELAEPGDVVLVKASRVMGLETVVERIVSPSAV